MSSNSVRRMFFFYAFLWIFSMSFGVGYAQEQQSIHNRANDHYNKKEYALARKLYAKLLDRKPQDSFLLRKLAACSQKINDYYGAMHFYTRLLTLQQGTENDYLNFGDILRCLNRYDEARAIYTQSSLKGNTLLKNRIKSCEIDWEKKYQIDIRVENYQTINTPYSEWGATNYPLVGTVFTSDNIQYATLFSNVKKNKKNVSRTDRSFFKILVEDSTQYRLMYELVGALSRYDLHAGPVIFSNNYDTAYFTVTNSAKISYSKKFSGTNFFERRLMILISVKHESGWSLAKPFVYNNPDKYGVGQAALSRDGSILYFTSDMPGGYGGTDIWYCEKEENGSWSLPANCGNVINTSDDEAFASVGKDGTFFFSSKGHVGMGGFDVFTAQGSKDKWDAPENMQQPVNSPVDDFDFIVQDNNLAYMASERLGGKGQDDVYKVYGNWSELKKRNQMAVLFDSILHKSGLGITEKIADKRGGNIATDTNNQSLQPFNKMEKYKPEEFLGSNNLYESKKGIIEQRDERNTLHVHLPEALYTYDTIETARLEKRKIHNPRVMKNTVNNRIIINYDFNIDTITVNDQKRLDSIVFDLHTNISLIAVVKSYTDCKGSLQYNLKLAKRRAISIKKYLYQKGISKDRISIQCVGKTTALIDCANGYDKKLQAPNRRSEIYIRQGEMKKL